MEVVHPPIAKEAEMFDSLDDQMKHDAAKETTKGEQAVKWVVVAALSVLLFGGLYFAVRMLE
jgi:hypothetical protein